MKTLQLTGGALTFSTDAKNKRRYKMNAYTGAPVRGWRQPVIIDLAGIKIGDGQHPIFRQHDPNRIAGWTESITNDGKGIVIEGTLTDTTEAGREVAALADDGFRWQASIGIEYSRVEDVTAGTDVTVNGRNLAGPITIIRQSTLKESSFVPLGADGDTSAVVLTAGSESLASMEEKPMTHDQFKAALSEHPDWIAAEVKQAKAAGAADSKAELKAMLAEFADNTKFAVDQYLDGKTIDEAKAIKLAIDAHVKAAVEAESAKVAKLEADLKAAKLEAEAHTAPPVQTATGGKPVDKFAGLEGEALIKAEWDANHNDCKAQFRRLDAYTLYRKSQKPVKG